MGIKDEPKKMFNSKIYINIHVFTPNYLPTYPPTSTYILKYRFKFIWDKFNLYATWNFLWHQTSQLKIIQT